jgi:hypothetical protein
MDDVLIIDHEHSDLRIIAKQINIFLIEKLKIELHPKKTILQKVETGIDFLGYVIHPEYTISRKRVVGNIKKKLVHFDKLLSETRNLEETEQIVRNAQAVVNSYWGHFKHADCGNLKSKLYLKHFGTLKKYLEKSDTGDHFVIKKRIFPEKKNA